MFGWGSPGWPRRPGLPSGLYRSLDTGRKPAGCSAAGCIQLDPGLPHFLGQVHPGWTSAPLGVRFSFSLPLSPFIPPSSYPSSYSFSYSLPSLSSFLYFILIYLQVLGVATCFTYTIYHTGGLHIALIYPIRCGMTCPFQRDDSRGLKTSLAGPHL